MVLMLIPISRIIMSEGSNHRRQSYNLYNIETGKVVNWELKEIKKALKDKVDIGGFSGMKSANYKSLRLNSYFINIGIAGEEQGEKLYYTVVKRRIFRDRVNYTLVNCVGKEYEFEKNELIELIKNRNSISGVKLIKD